MKLYKNQFQYNNVSSSVQNTNELSFWFLYQSKLNDIQNYYYIHELQTAQLAQISYSV